MKSLVIEVDEKVVKSFKGSKNEILKSKLRSKSKLKGKVNLIV